MKRSLNMNISIRVKVDDEINSAKAFYNIYGEWYEFFYENGAIDVSHTDYHFINRVMNFEVRVPLSKYFNFVRELNGTRSPKLSMCTYKIKR